MTGVKGRFAAEWRKEEKAAQMEGWDFSHIAGRYEEEMPSWEFRRVVLKYTEKRSKLLDIDTGGGEELLALGHPYENTSATEGYGPNIELCKRKLLPFGIDFRPGKSGGKLPFGDESFDIVTNRHGSFDQAEVYRVLKPGGMFITQQVGAENDRELVRLLVPEAKELPFPEQYLDLTAGKLENAGFTLLCGREEFRTIRFFDIGALVWFARVIEWEFPGFSVESHMKRLLLAQEQLERHGDIRGRTHRFIIVAQKSKKNPR